MEQLDSVPGKAVETGAEFSLWRTLPRRTGTCSRWCSGARCLMCPTKETGTEAHQEARFILINSTSKLVIFWWFASSQAFRIKVMRTNSLNYFSTNKWLSRASPTWQWFTQILVSISKRTGWPKKRKKRTKLLVLTSADRWNFLSDILQWKCLPPSSTCHWTEYASKSKYKNLDLKQLRLTDSVSKYRVSWHSCNMKIRLT
jgi:hypothetical protein